MPMPAQPFALNATPVTDGEVLDKWNVLVADIRSESEILGSLPHRRRALPGGGEEIPRRHRRRPRA